MSVCAILAKARDLIGRPGNWTQGVMARDYKRNEVLPLDEQAVRFSLDGALVRAADFASEEGQAAHFLAVRHLRSMFKGTIAEFNDRSSHGKILEYLNRAIRATEAA